MSKNEPRDVPDGTRLTRHFALGLAEAALAAPSLAQERFPARPIRMLVPWVPVRRSTCCCAPWPSWRSPPWASPW
jgi:hypothetical protein